MRKCSKCLITKPESDYYFKDKRVGRLHTQCKQCYKENRAHSYKRHYKKYKEYYLQRAKIRRQYLRIEFRTNMLKYLEGKICEVCGENDKRTFEFDHKSPSEKKFGIARAVSLGYSWEEVREEINKCRIVCANCHKKQTAEQFSWYKK